VQSQIEAKGKAEARKLENNRIVEDAQNNPPTNSPANTIPFGGMRWGRTGTTTP